MTAFLPDMVTIGKVGRPFGVHGAVKVRSLSDRPGQFEQLHEVRMAGERGQTIDRRRFDRCAKLVRSTSSDS